MLGWRPGYLTSNLKINFPETFRATAGLILYCKLGCIQRQPSFLPQVRLHLSFYSTSSSISLLPFLFLFSFVLSLSFSFCITISPAHNEVERSTGLICPPGNNLKHETKAFLTSLFYLHASPPSGATSATTAIGNKSCILSPPLFPF